jgi:molybdopterin converting factor small subunit
MNQPHPRDTNVRESKDVMTIQVLYFGLVRNIVRVAEETVTLPIGATVRDLFDFLFKKYGDPFRDALFTSDGTLVANAIILLDGSNILYQKGVDTEIDHQSSTHILLTTTAIGGG